MFPLKNWAKDGDIADGDVCSGRTIDAASMNRHASSIVRWRYRKVIQES